SKFVHLVLPTALAVLVMAADAGAQQAPGTDAGRPAVTYGWIVPSPDVPSPEPADGVARLKELQQTMNLLAAANGAIEENAQKDEKLQKQVDLLQKQLEVQQKMIQLLLDLVQKQPSPGSPVDKLQTQVAVLEARSKQAAQRDVQLAQAVDSL